ncbi:hypothetical protein B0H16DRAFT_1750586 [Mycena metata]|uniref:Uncharacterized protein n=1 Tax=Mycena metata TaxID=1033252 RepID=A0AAD7DQ52_9AGAR|nr:hypothetical protein B0H16DRAFT_1750586 [Mycena metata]
MAGKGKKRFPKQPRPSLVTVDIDKLRDILSLCQEPPEAVKEAPSANPRFILTRRATRARAGLAGPSVPPTLPPDASLVSPPRSPVAPPSPRPVHRPAPQLRVFAHQPDPASATNAFAALASALDTSFASDTPDVTLDLRADQSGSGAQGKRGGANPNLPPPLADRHVTLPAPVTSDEAPRASAPCSTPKQEKKTAFLTCKDHALAANSLEELATAFRGLVSLIREYKKSGPTAECFEALDAVQERLDNAHEIPGDAESP